MSRYCHIHRGITPSGLEKKFIKNFPLFFSKKNSSWYNIEKDISKDYNGYRMYEIYIPKNRYTISFNPRIAGKIVKVTADNINEYHNLKKEYIGHINFIEEMKKRNIIGIDATLEHKDIIRAPEGYIWQKPRDIKIKLIEIKKL